MFRWKRGRGSLYGEMQFIMGIGHTPPPFPCGQTDTTENITFPLLRWRALKMLVSIRVDCRLQRVEVDGNKESKLM